MFITDKLVFIQLQKTGCTHIAKLLDHTLGGQVHGKHNAPSQEMLNSSRLFVSSIRNPWEWYVSLWSFGCDGYGGFRNRVIESELTKNEKLWKYCYSDSRNPLLFRNWLKMVHNPNYRFDFGEGYGHSKIFGLAGFYTYRYLKLCCKNNHMLNSGRFETKDDLFNFEKDNCYISKWIRNESLEQDLIDILCDLRLCVSRSQEKRIYSFKKTNTSSRNQPISFYYDGHTKNIIYEREQLIINKFGYSFSDL